MAAGLVSHNITTATGVTFAVVSWVPDTSAPDVGAVPVARITDGTLVAAVTANGLKVDVGALPALPAGTNNIGDVDVLTMPAITGSVSVTGTPSVNATLAAETTKKIGVVAIDATQLGTLIAGGVPVVSGGYEYETVAVSQSDQILGATGAVGDYLESLLCVVATAATSQVQIKDGNGSLITVLPNNVGAGVGTYPIPIGLTCVNATTPGWKITTAAGVTVLASGNFT
jgi:hypothetical protein